MAWVKIIPETKSSKAVLPIECKKHIRLRAGLKEINIEAAYDLEPRSSDSYDQPFRMKLPEKLVLELRLPVDLPYRMEMREEEVNLGPVIGLLLGNENHRYTPEHMVKYNDRFDIYPKIGGLVVAFSPLCVDWRNLIAYGLYYQPFKQEWKFGSFPLPAAVYRRDFHTNESDLHKLKKITKNNIFNSYRPSKWETYLILMEEQSLRQLLPQTVRINTGKDCMPLLSMCNKLILKPNNLSRGRGIYVASRQNPGNVVFANSSTGENAVLSEDDLAGWIEANLVRKDYIAQEYINLARYQGKPFDIRIVMQKNVYGHWHCSGVECRVAAHKSMLTTNISRGGSALTLSEAFSELGASRMARHKLKKELLELCLMTCLKMDGTGEHYHELGIDVAIDHKMNLKFIEVNVFPSFHGFKKMNYSNYLFIRRAPLLYANKMAGF